MSTAEVTTPKTDAPELRIVQDATCTFCGCVCDDIDLTVDLATNHITKAKSACVLGKSWFFNHHIDDRPDATIDGQPATYEEAI